MESHAKLLGHAAHPALVAFPIGLLLSALGFDVLHTATGDKKWAQLAYWNMIAGCLSGWASMLPGAVDWWFLPKGSRARRVATIHALAADAGINLFFFSWLLRRSDPANPPPKALGLALLGGLVISAAGWLGGELVQRLGVSVAPEARYS